MVTGTIRIELALSDCHSLKEKRQILRSVIARTRNRFGVSVAEVEDQDLWQRAVIGAACVGNSEHRAAEILHKVLTFVIGAHAECEVVDHQVEIYTL